MSERRASVITQRRSSDPTYDVSFSELTIGHVQSSIATRQTLGGLRR